MTLHYDNYPGLPDGPLRFSPMYEVPPEAEAWLQSCATELSRGELSVETAVDLAVNRIAVIMPEEVESRVWTTLATHYERDGLQPVDEQYGHRASEDLLAAIKCEQYSIPVRSVVEEYQSRDWTAAVEPYKPYDYSAAHVYFSTFVDACRRVPLAKELRQQRAKLEEVKQPYRPGNDNGVDPMVAYSATQSVIQMREARIDALGQQLYVRGVPRAKSSAPEQTIIEVFGDTATAQLFAENSIIELPDLVSAYTSRLLGQQSERQLYDIDRILSAKTAPE